MLREASPRRTSGLPGAVFRDVIRAASETAATAAAAGAV